MYQDFGLEKKIVVITGGAGLLGKSFARAVALQGGVPVLADNDEVKLNVAKSELEKETGVPIEIFRCDITSVASIQATLNQLTQSNRSIHALVNNAYPRNSTYGAKFEDVTYESFCENMNAHLGGYFLCSQIFAKRFVAQGVGKIINIGSIYGVVAPRFEIYDGTKMDMPVEYAVIKSGVIHLTRYMAQYFKGQGIQVNCISPGGVHNAQPPSFVERYSQYTARGKMLDPDDLTGTLLFLLSKWSDSMNGQNLIVDDGWSL